MKSIAELQEFVGVTADGVWGPKSQAALDAILHPVVNLHVTDSGTADRVDDRSEKNIATLLGPVQDLARMLVRHGTAALHDGQVVKVTSGTRTFAEQDALFAQGGVTKARGGYSNHNYGLAFDITVFTSGGQPVWDGPQYHMLGQIGKSIGLSWGGDWKSIVDEPHFELRPGWASNLSESEMISELRRRHNVGQNYL